VAQHAALKVNVTDEQIAELPFDLDRQGYELGE
jgi:hypothetical protein